MDQDTRKMINESAKRQVNERSNVPEREPTGSPWKVLLLIGCVLLLKLTAISYLDTLALSKADPKAIHFVYYSMHMKNMPIELPVEGKPIKWGHKVALYQDDQKVSDQVTVETLFHEIQVLQLEEYVPRFNTIRIIRPLGFDLVIPVGQYLVEPVATPWVNRWEDDIFSGSSGSYGVDQIQKVYRLRVEDKPMDITASVPKESWTYFDLTQGVTDSRRPVEDMDIYPLTLDQTANYRSGLQDEQYYAVVVDKIQDLSAYDLIEVDVILRAGGGSQKEEVVSHERLHFTKGQLTAPLSHLFYQPAYRTYNSNRNGESRATIETRFESKNSFPAQIHLLDLMKEEEKKHQVVLQTEAEPVRRSSLLFSESIIVDEQEVTGLQVVFGQNGEVDQRWLQAKEGQWIPAEVGNAIHTAFDQSTYKDLWHVLYMGRQIEDVSSLGTRKKGAGRDTLGLVYRPGNPLADYIVHADMDVFDQVLYGIELIDRDDHAKVIRLEFEHQVME